MKVVYTPRDTVGRQTATSERYKCKAEDDLKNKKREQMANLITEINRRLEENFHLG